MTEQADAQPALPANDCTVCTHPQAAQIDAGLLAGTSVRATAETFGLSRSSVGRHRLNHLSAEAAIESETGAPSTERPPLRLIDVHVQLTALADRLESVVTLAAKTRKATAATAAMRELRQTLTAIAELQANPDLLRAASREKLEETMSKGMASCICRMIDFVLHQFGIGRTWDDGWRTDGDSREALVASLIADCLRVIIADGVRAHFDEDVDTAKAREFVEAEALDRARRMEEEVQRRVEAELRRREAQQRPAIEAKPVPAIEGGVAWTTS